jgi:PAS domain S-box-containing protein
MTVSDWKMLGDNLPTLCWVANPDGYITWYNRRWYEFTGTTPEEMEGWGWQSVHDPKELPRVLERWQRSINTGEPFEMVFPLRRADGALVPHLTRVNPARDTGGNIVNWYGVNTDVSDQIKAEHELSVLSDELSHRIKNIFSVVTGLIGISSRSVPVAKAFAADLHHRINALATAHSFIRPATTGSGPMGSRPLLHALFHTLLAAYQERDRVSITGDDILIRDRAGTALALMIHELATNSIKYGSLSVPGGRLDIVTKLSDHSLRIDWIEHDGPPVVAPLSMGFGSNLTRISIEAQLGGRITYDWQAQGLIVCATIPRSSATDEPDTTDGSAFPLIPATEGLGKS